MSNIGGTGANTIDGAIKTNAGNITKLQGDVTNIQGDITNIQKDNALNVKYDDANKNSVTLGNAGSPVKVSNVADGTSKNDAVNYGQLQAVDGKVNTAVDTANAAAIEAAKHTTVVQGKNITVTKGKNTAGGVEYTVATADDLTVNSVYSRHN